MRQKLYRPLTIAALVFAAAAAICAQPGGPPTPSARMFDGETLSYEGKVNKVLHGITVADLVFTATLGSNDQLVIKSQAVSKGTLLKLFRYSFFQQYTSTVDATSFNILETTKHDVQKERVRDSEAVFDYKEKRVRFVETDPKDPTRPPRRIASEVREPIYDMISAIYAVRLSALSVGKRMEFSVSDSGLVYKVPFVVTAREQQKTVLGKLWCWRVEPEIFGKDRLIEQKGSMVVWFVDDARRTPVRSEIKTSFGKFDIKLKSATGVK
jgi:Protein of unknown function (DUF3108)